MTFIVFLRYVSDAGFYFFFAGIVAGILGARPLSLALGLTLQCLALTAGYLARGKKLRFAPLVLPAAYILFAAEGLAERLALLAYLIHSLKLLRSEEYEPTWDHEAELFSRFWKAALMVLLLWLPFGPIIRNGQALLREAVVPGATVTTISLILLTRALRHDRDVYSQGRRQLADLAVFGLLLALSAVLGSRPVLDGFFYLAGLVFTFLVLPILRIAIWLFGQLARVVGLLLSFILRDTDLEMPELSESQGFPSEVLDPGAAAEAGEGARLLRVLLIVAGAAALAFLTYKLLKMLLARGTALAESGESKIERAPLPEAEGPPPRSRARAPVERVRLEYRRFLRLCGQRGIRLRPGDTSLRVEQKSAGLSDRDAARELRAIYIAARYDGSGTDESAKRAQDAVRRIRRTWRGEGAERGP